MYGDVELYFQGRARHTRTNFGRCSNHPSHLAKLDRRRGQSDTALSYAARATIRLSAAAITRSPLGATSTILNSSSISPKERTGSQASCDPRYTIHMPFENASLSMPHN
jgi:hypothetical protein